MAQRPGTVVRQSVALDEMGQVGEAWQPGEVWRPGEVEIEVKKASRDSNSCIVDKIFSELIGYVLVLLVVFR